MRIISKFHDLYDNCMAYGLDESVVYLRETSVIFDNSKTSYYQDQTQHDLFKKLTSGPRISEHNKKDLKATFKLITIMLAGKAYGGVEITIVKPGQHTIKTTFYDQEGLVKFLAKYDMIYDDLNYKYIVRWKRTGADDKSIAQHLELNGDPKFMELAVKLKLPVFMVVKDDRYSKVIKDPCLKDQDFYRALDHQTTFQEINMFLSGILAPENHPMVKIEDKYKIIEHGFDKFSFRKPKEKR
jgi:hypothetical protein